MTEVTDVTDVTNVTGVTDVTGVAMQRLNHLCEIVRGIMFSNGHSDEQTPKSVLWGTSGARNGQSRGKSDDGAKMTGSFVALLSRPCVPRLLRRCAPLRGAFARCARYFFPFFSLLVQI